MALIAAFAILWWIAFNSSVTRRAYAQIKHNMTRAEVERILGAPSGKADWPETETFSSHSMIPGDFDEEDEYCVWVSHRVLIQLWFNADGKVTRTQMNVRGLSDPWAWLFDRLDPAAPEPVF